MEIYQINDIANQITYYFVSDDATKAQGEALNLKNAQWIVGDLTAANGKLNEVVTLFLNDPSTLSHITCTKSIGKDADGHNIWVGCNFLTEEDNTDTLYEFHTDTNPGFTQATGTIEGQTVYKQKQQDILNWISLNQVTTLTELPKAPKPVV